ncbi:MAG: hypothetical protein KC684_06830, partial [Candidatus Omnitrophica bacterium]|nr:hypothetical protein [Candidatus Omnitrophota bacterium]
AGEMTEKEGAIPNGKVEFSDLTKDTHGFQYYDNGKKDGDFREYSAADILLREAQYWNGTLVSNREYYEDGVLKKEENYEDARDQKIEGLTGRGKFYSPDGGLKFEWRYLKSEKLGYNKSYNRNGRLTKEVYYDENGQPMRSPEAPGAAAGNP